MSVAFCIPAIIIKVKHVFEGGREELVVRGKTQLSVSLRALSVGGDLIVTALEMSLLLISS